MKPGPRYFNRLFLVIISKLFRTTLVALVCKRPVSFVLCACCTMLFAMLFTMFSSTTAPLRNSIFCYLLDDNISQYLQRASNQHILRHIHLAPHANISSIRDYVFNAVVIAVRRRGINGGKIIMKAS